MESNEETEVSHVPKTYRIYGMRIVILPPEDGTETCGLETWSIIARARGDVANQLISASKFDPNDK